MFGAYADCYIQDGEMKVDRRNLPIAAQGHTVSNSDGSLKMYCLIGVICDKNDKVLNTPIDYGVNWDQNTSVILTISDSLYYVIYEDSDTTIQGVQQVKLYSVIVRSKGDSLYIVRPKTLLYPFPVYGLVGIEDTIGGWWLVARTGPNVFSSIYFNEMCFGCRTQQSTIPLDLAPDWKVPSTHDERHMTRSPSGNYLAILDSDNSIIANERRISNTASIFNLHFDKNSGKLSLQDTVFFYHSEDIYDEFVLGLSMEYSSNDSILYYKYHHRNDSEEYSVNRFAFQGETQRSELWRYSSNETSRRFRGYGRNLKLMSNGKMYYLTHSGNGTNDPNSSTHFHEIALPNIWSSNAMEKDKYVILTYDPDVYGHTYSKYNYIRVKPRIRYDCGAEVTFEDHCDYALKNTSIEFLVEDEAGSGVLIPRGSKPRLNYTRDGNYLFKVILRSPDAMYKEIHIDTIRVHIPPKPVADFKAMDTVVCRYTSVTFLNKSTGSWANPPIKPKWVWSFGDGTTSTVSHPGAVKHAYEDVGVYPVSLFYHNGYCDSTLVRNQYIRVVDAPRPGFSVDNQFGCSPFTINITDTSTRDILFKEYYFSDSGWQVVFGNSLSHTFEETGDYIVVQRLHGRSGCVVQEDTARIHVAPGIREHDSVSMQLGSYLTNEAIRVQWFELEAASKYLLYRDEVFVDTVKGVWFTDTVGNPGLYTYEIYALDSCGTRTQTSEAVRPIFLEGQVVGSNEAAKLTFTPYLGSGEAIHYSIHSADDQVFSDALPMSELVDDHFEIAGAREKCYVVAGHFDTLITRSNELCLSYQPILFIPGAITPNGDGLNDTFKPVIYGIESYSMQIYNRWGQRIADLENEGWSPSEGDSGVFMYALRARANNGRIIHRSGMLTVLR